MTPESSIQAMIFTAPPHLCPMLAVGGEHAVDRVMLRDDLVEKGLFGAVALITVGAGTWAGLAVGASTARVTGW